MSVDSAQLPQPTLTDVLLPLVTPIAQQAAASLNAETKQQLAEAQQRLSVLEQQFATAAAAQAPVIVGDLTQAAGAVLTTVEHDTTTQRVLVWGIAGGVLVVAALIVLFAMAGNSTANHWIGAAPAAAAALVLWLSNAGVSLPKRTTTPTTNA